MPTSTCRRWPCEMVVDLFLGDVGNADPVGKDTGLGQPRCRNCRA